MTTIKQASQPSIDYKAAGVDIESSDKLVHDIKGLAESTTQKGVLSGIGGFGALFELPLDQYTQPILVAATDGVGTKLHIANQLDQHDTIGIDLVAMCANDILCQGAKPLFFLDYYATGNLIPTQAQDVLKGIVSGCNQAELALIGGETAEMPGSYPQGEYDLAGFCIGIVEKSKIIHANLVENGDRIIGIASSGAHSNGYSLIRKIIEHSQTNLTMPFDCDTLGSILLTPTKIYVPAILSLLEHVPVHGIAHITGGGILDNLPRILPEHTQAIIETSRWNWPPLFEWIQQQGNIALQEMYRTFNMGIGMTIIVKQAHVAQSLELLAKHGEQAWEIGYIEASQELAPSTIIK